MLKVLQYNIFFGNCVEISINDRLKNICKEIINTNADVVCLQEVLIDKLYILLENLKNTYHYSYPNILNRIYDTVIFSKYPIINPTEYIYNETQMGRNLKIIQINKNNNIYIIANTHFESEFGKNTIKKINQYKESSLILLDICKTLKVPIILCSDTNICRKTESSFMESYTYNDNWKDVWYEVGRPEEKKNTYDSYTNPILINKIKNNPKLTKYRSRLDRIIHNSNLYATDLKMVGTNTETLLSDHYGLLCTFNNIKPNNYKNYLSLIRLDNSKSSTSRTIPYKKSLFK